MTNAALNSSPLVLVFLKAPRPQSVKTRLAEALGNDQTLDVYRGMVARQLRQIPPAWDVEIRFTPADAEGEMKSWLGDRYRYVDQGTGDLGERLDRGFARAFESGRQVTMAVGGDCPELDETTFVEALNRLSRADVVMGPAEDGGYYLIALRKSAPELFKDIPWGTPHVLSLTLARAKVLGLSRELLAPKEDIDDLPSYQRYLSRVANESSGERIAVVIPALNEASHIAAAVLSSRQSFPGAPIVVVDGGSTDDTCAVAKQQGARVVQSSRGRGVQCRAGVASAPPSDWLMFLHADSVLPANAYTVVTGFISEPRSQIATFRLRFDSTNLLLRVFGWFTRFDTVFTRFGDQGILIRRDFYEALGGFPTWNLFEDVALLQRARAVTRVHSLPGYVTTSARRFQKRGVVAQQWLNAKLLYRYLRGTPPAELSELYHAERAVKAITPSTGVSVSPESAH